MYTTGPKLKRDVPGCDRQNFQPRTSLSPFCSVYSKHEELLSVCGGSAVFRGSVCRSGDDVCKEPRTEEPPRAQGSTLRADRPKPGGVEPGVRRRHMRLTAGPRVQAEEQHARCESCLLSWTSVPRPGERS